MFIEFDEENHRYYADGEIVPSTSEIISPLNDLSGIREVVLAIASARGTFLHDSAEVAFSTGELQTEEYLNDNTPIGEPSYWLWFKGFVKWFKEIGNQYKPLMQEQFMVAEYDGMKFGLTCDFLSTCKFLIDWKTCCALKPVHAVQLEGYKIGLEYNDHEVDRLGLGHLRKDKDFRLVTEDTPRQKVFNTFNISDKEMFIYLLTKWYKDRGLR